MDASGMYYLGISSVCDVNSSNDDNDVTMVSVQSWRSILLMMLPWYLSVCAVNCNEDRNRVTGSGAHLEGSNITENSNRNVYNRNDCQIEL